MTTEDRQTTGSAPPAARLRGAQPGHVLSEFERLLTESGCPNCRHVAEIERSFFSWFEIESHTSAEVQAKLRAAMGMCPAHARRLLEGVGEGHVMTIVMREALAGARVALRPDAQIGPCPACESVAFGTRHARTLLIDGLRDPALARAYTEHDGVCLVHLLDVLPNTDSPTAKVLTERLLGSLYDCSATSLAGLLAGLDADAARRAMWRERLPNLSTTGSTLQRLNERLELDACPVCLAAGIAGRDYLEWLLTHSAEDDPALDTDPGEFCARHVHDVALADPSDTPNRALQRKRASRIAQLERFLARLPHAPTAERRRRRSGPDVLEAIRAELLAPPHCTACHARDGVERAQHDLVVASLGLVTVRDRYERGHGLCIRHARQVSDGPAGRVVRQYADARLAVIAWEVHETARKYAWAFRHEPSGPEKDGWLRGLSQIDGHVFEGNEASARPR
ncbi:MAG: hypothetical protein WCD11_35870 [Solirubrobacteraceae bacterium]